MIRATRRFNILLLLLVLIQAVILFVPMADATQQTTPEKITFGYQPNATPGGVIIEALKHDRILRQALLKQKISLVFDPITKGSDAINLLKSGKLVLTTIGDMPCIESALQLDIAIVAQLKQNYASVVGPSGMLPKDLKNKRIGYAHATSGHFALLKTLANAGYSDKDVTLAPMEVSAMAEAITSGKIDAFAAWEPTPSIVISRHPNRYTTIGRQFNLSFLVANREFVRQHPEAIRHIAAALIRAMHWMSIGSENLGRAVRWNVSTAADTSKPPVSEAEIEIVRRSTRQDLATLEYSPRIRRQLLQPQSVLGDQFKFLKTIGKIPASSQWSKVSGSIDPAYIEQVLKAPAAYDLKRYDYE